MHAGYDVNTDTYARINEGRATVQDYKDYDAFRSGEITAANISLINKNMLDARMKKGSDLTRTEINNIISGSLKNI